MPQLSRLAAILFLAGITGAATVKAQSGSQISDPNILPETPGAVNGGNPFQGLGRPDDTGPMRAAPIQQYAPGNNTNGLFSTGGSFSPTPSLEQPGFAGQAGFSSSNNFNQAPGETNPGPNAGLMQNANPTPQSISANESIDKEESTKVENGLSMDKLLNKSHQDRFKSTHQTTSREANQLTMALKEMNSGNYPKCLETLNSIIKNEPKNAQAYYVKAVTNVLMRDFANARENYEMTLRCTNDEQLISKTKAGLLKLGR